METSTLNRNFGSGSILSDSDPQQNTGSELDPQENQSGSGKDRMRPLKTVIDFFAGIRQSTSR